MKKTTIDKGFLARNLLLLRW